MANHSAYELTNALVQKYEAKHNPCKGGCPEFNAVCHIFCERLKEHEEAREKYRVEMLAKIKKQERIDSYFAESDKRNYWRR